VVLVAEDDASVRLTIEFILEDEGFELLLAEDGEEALQLAQDKHPDVILLDHMMPKMDGKEVLTALRNISSTRDIPVLVLSGMGRGAPEEWPGALFVGKPFSPEELVGRIREALSASSAGSAQEPGGRPTNPEG
jgi:DNA-binding response OmpR family regulator